VKSVFIIFMALSILLYAGCSKQPATPDSINNNVADEHTDGMITNPEDKVTDKQPFINFFKEKDEAVNVIFFEEEDLDQDGSNEVVIGAGPSAEEYTYIYVLRDNNGVIEQLGDNLASGGYSVYELKLIQIQNSRYKSIYLGLTNFASMIGFAIYDCRGPMPNQVVYSASATGSGTDELVDSDNDGQFDGYVQYRSSYDVLYFPVQKIFEWEEQNFVHDRTEIEIPGYPERIEDLVLQYFTLRVLDDGKSVAIDNRLAEISMNQSVRDFDIPLDVMYSALYNHYLAADSVIGFESKQNDNSAIVKATYSYDKYKTDRYTLKMTKSSERWHIDHIEKETTYAFPDEIEIPFTPLQMETLYKGEPEPEWTSIGSMPFGKIGQDELTLEVYEEPPEKDWPNHTAYNGILEWKEQRYLIREVSSDLLFKYEDSCQSVSTCQFLSSFLGFKQYVLIGSLAPFGNGPGRMIYIVYDSVNDTFLTFDAWGVPGFIDLDGDGVDEFVIEFQGTGMNLPDLTIIRFNKGIIEVNYSIKGVLGGGSDNAVYLQKDLKRPIIKLSNVWNESAPTYSFTYNNGKMIRQR